ncbi:MAG TPA: hypothetical protein VMW23_04650 [Sedimentisphaerales bacterium]|nr:hypothetical protein [Sedimentisphaerales bacterium]
MTIVILVLIKVFGSKYSTTTEEVQTKTRQLKYTWDGVFGFLFFMGAAIMGASLPIRVLMLAVGIVVGHVVKGIVELQKEKKNVSRSDEPKDEQKQ